jgi:diguanylate cyclase (GGDEF)-like protein
MRPGCCDRRSAAPTSSRLGGDEFTVFPLEASDTSASLLISRLTESVQAFNAEGRRPYRLAMSVGVARFEPGSAWTIHDLLDEADRRLYDAKRSRVDAGQRRSQPASEK